MWRAAIAASALFFVGCFHDFDAFTPEGSPGDDAGGVSASNDGSSDATTPHDANGPTDAQNPPGNDAPITTIDASGCGATCRTTATGCAGQCADSDQSCEAPCDGGAGCISTCQSKEATCISNCVTTCETCTSQAGCIDQAGCTAAAP